MTDSKPSSNSEERQDEKWYERTRYQILLFAIGIALFGLVLGLLLDWYIDPETSTQKKDLVQALGLITAGVAGAVGIFFTWRGQERNQRNTQEQFRRTRESQEQNQMSTQAQLDNAQEELRLTRQGQITERFTRAIDQLGSDKLEIRLGGIYALERIDKESPERAYHGTVMEVLTAYVRENAPWPPKSSEPSESPDDSSIRPDVAGSVSDSASDKTAEQGRGTEQDAEPAKRAPSTDIQAILDVITRRAEEHVPEKHRVQHLDLRRTDLRGANLRRVHLEGAYLHGAHLERADLSEAHLEGAILAEAHLERANLSNAHLEGAILFNALLEGAFLPEARLEGAFLRRARLEGANLSSAHLEGALLHGAHLEGAELSDANLEGAELSSAHLEGAQLHGAHLEGANLRRVHLEGALLHEAHLKGAQLYEAHLEGANLSSAHLEGATDLTSEQIRWAIGRENTKLPEYLVDRPAAWSKSSVEQMLTIEERLEQLKSISSVEQILILEDRLEQFKSIREQLERFESIREQLAKELEDQ